MARYGVDDGDAGRVVVCARAPRDRVVMRPEDDPFGRPCRAAKLGMDVGAGPVRVLQRSKADLTEKATQICARDGATLRARSIGEANSGRRLLGSGEARDEVALE